MLPYLVLIGFLGVLAAFFIISKQRARFGETAKRLARDAPPGPKSAQRKQPMGVYTREEVAKHDQLEDLWVILKQRETGEYKVFDLTPYVEEHPGGEVIGRNAGGDATEGFYDIQHTSTVFDLIDHFCIGTLADP